MKFLLAELTGCSGKLSTTIKPTPPDNCSLIKLIRKFEPDIILLSHIDCFPNSLNDVDKDEKTALMWAVEKGRECVIQRAFENGVCVEKLDNDGWSAVMYAARRGNMDILKSLLEVGADLNHATKEDGFTALHLAAGNELIDVCLSLIEAGANPNVRDFENRVAIDYMRMQKNKEKLQEFIEETYRDGNTFAQIHKLRVEALTEKSASTFTKTQGALSRVPPAN